MRELLEHSIAALENTLSHFDRKKRPLSWRVLVRQIAALDQELAAEMGKNGRLGE